MNYGGRDGTPHAFYYGMIGYQTTGQENSMKTETQPKTYTCWNCGEKATYGKPHACDVILKDVCPSCGADEQTGCYCSAQPKGGK